MLEYFRKIRQPLAIVLGLFIIYMSLFTRLNLTQYISDKAMHFLAYGAWAAVACATPRGVDRLAIYAAIIFATGLAIEIVQPEMGRDKSILDLLANSAGMVVGILLALRARRLLYGKAP